MRTNAIACPYVVVRERWDKGFLMSSEQLLECQPLLSQAPYPLCGTIYLSYKISNNVFQEQVFYSGKNIIVQPK